MLAKDPNFSLDAVIGGLRSAAVLVSASLLARDKAALREMVTPFCMRKMAELLDAEQASDVLFAQGHAPGGGGFEVERVRLLGVSTHSNRSFFLEDGEEERLLPLARVVGAVYGRRTLSYRTVFGEHVLVTSAPAVVLVGLQSVQPDDKGQWDWQVDVVHIVHEQTHEQSLRRRWSMLLLQMLYTS